MERLTMPYKYGDGYCSKCAESCGECDGCWGMDEIVNRLGEYEETELTPAEIERSKMEIEAGCVKAVARTYGIDINRLRQLAEADRAGRLMVLPEGGESDG